MANAEGGFLLVDKPDGWTSRRALDRVQRRVGLKGGNEGTLDPFATGLLLVGLGAAPRFFRFFRELPKGYEAELRLGTGTDTLDREGKVIVEEPVRPFTLADAEGAAADLTGDISQKPPAYSALKVDGRRAYALARTGEEVDLPARPATVNSLKIRSHSKDRIVFQAEVASGTYIRALGRDLARALGNVGHLTALRRTYIGAFKAEDATFPDDITTADLRPCGGTLYWLPRIEITPEEAAFLKNGNRFPCDRSDGYYRAFLNGAFLGIGRVARREMKPERLLPL